MTSLITEKFLFDQNADDVKSCGSIGSDEAVLFVNPCNYTLDDDDDLFDKKASNNGQEVSAFDADLIEEENSAGDKGENVFGNREELQRMIQDGSHSVD